MHYIGYTCSLQNIGLTKLHVHGSFLPEDGIDFVFNEGPTLADAIVAATGGSPRVSRDVRATGGSTGSVFEGEGEGEEEEEPLTPMKASRDWLRITVDAKRPPGSVLPGRKSLTKSASFHYPESLTSTPCLRCSFTSLCFGLHFYHIHLKRSLRLTTTAPVNSSLLRRMYSAASCTQFWNRSPFLCCGV
jgi:hypothetical protein